MTRTTIGGAAALAAVVMTLGGQPAGGEETGVFSGGCFRGVRAVFEHVRGVVRATAGYAGGDAGGASYLFSHRRQPYIVINDLPKLSKPERELPDLWRDQPVRWPAGEAASR